MPDEPLTSGKTRGTTSPPPSVGTPLRSVQDHLRSAAPGNEGGIDASGFEAAGQALIASWQARLDEAGGLRLDPPELQALLLAAGLSDRLARVRRQLNREGLTIKVSGSRKAHPLLTVERATAAEIARLLARVGFSAEAPKDPAKVAAGRASQAARRRR